VHEQRDPHPGQPDDGGDEKLPKQFGAGFQFLFVVVNAERDHEQPAQEQHHQLPPHRERAFDVQAQIGQLDERQIDPGRQRQDHQVIKQDIDGKRGEHRAPAQERHGIGVDLPLDIGLIDDPPLDGKLLERRCEQQRQREAHVEHVEIYQQPVH
jgi:hypothetical protein